jgi:hypothetical protein
MLKRDRTAEEKAFDARLKRGIMRLGPIEPSTQPGAEPFGYQLVWDRLGRKGQRCRVLKMSRTLVRVQFEDGFETTMNRQAIRRAC